MQLVPIDVIIAVCRLEPGSPIPGWATKGNFFSITRTYDELSVVCAQSVVPSDTKVEKDWRCLKVKGPLDFGLTGILASLADPLAKAGISLFAISTFDTDYLLVKHADFDRATQVLVKAGHHISGPAI